MKKEMTPVSRPTLAWPPRRAFVNIQLQGDIWRVPVEKGILMVVLLFTMAALTAKNCCAAAEAPKSGEGTSWLGREIILKKPGVKLSAARDGGTLHEIDETNDIVMTVKRDEGGRIMIQAPGISGWLRKDDAVLVDDAIPFFTGQIRGNPGDARARVMRSYAEFHKRNLDNALNDAGEAIKLNPNCALAYCVRGCIFTDKRAYAKAIEQLDTAIRLKPNNLWALNCRAGAFWFLKDYARAIRDCDEAIRTDPKYGSVFNIRGAAHLARGEYQEAIRDYDEAIRLEPKDSAALNNRGKTHEANKRGRESLILTGACRGR
jgi:tetratricopeptide (TPR) repeat protein